MYKWEYILYNILYLIIIDLIFICIIYTQYIGER